jgi:hypothetical protein
MAINLNTEDDVLFDHARQYRIEEVYATAAEIPDAAVRKLILEAIDLTRATEDALYRAVTLNAEAKTADAVNQHVRLHAEARAATGRAAKRLKQAITLAVKAAELARDRAPEVTD